VLASLGADGAVLVDDKGPLHGEAPVGSLVSAVGAGDAMLAGFLAAGGAGPAALRNGLVWAAAQVQHEGTLYRDNGTEIAVTLHDDVDRERVLAHPSAPPPGAAPVDPRADR
jgi:1-phosphofructokinase